MKFCFTQQGYLQAREYLKSIGRFEEVSAYHPFETVSLANELFEELT